MPKAKRQPSSNSDSKRRDKRGDRGNRRKSCTLCQNKVDSVDYKDVETLRRFVSDRGKLRGRRVTGACRRHNTQIAKAVKRAREIALLPYVAEQR
ncbi:MAG: 30S ribosomal protein S18 [Solirubrobacterales bacterium]